MASDLGIHVVPHCSSLNFFAWWMCLRRSKILLMRSRLGTSMGRALVASSTHIPDVVKAGPALSERSFVLNNLVC